MWWVLIFNDWWFCAAISGGFELEWLAGFQFARWLKEIGIDLVDCSTGGQIFDAHVPATPGFQIQFSDAIRREADIATGGVGLITDAHQAEEILEHGKADGVLLARKLLINPYWPLHAARELGVDVAWPNQYARAKRWNGLTYKVSPKNCSTSIRKSTPGPFTSWVCTTWWLCLQDFDDDHHRGGEKVLEAIQQAWIDEVIWPDRHAL